MHSRNPGFIPALAIVAVIIAIVITANLTYAQSKNRQVGTQYTVTADPLVARPNAQPCVVQLFNNLQFALFSDTDQNFTATPPAGCSGPWQKVVLDVDFKENAGRQFDRTASLYVGNTNLYFGTTPEPLPAASNATNTWHIERDVTDYGALFTTTQTGTMVLQNCTTDCPAPYNTLLTGVFTVSAALEFYPAQGAAPRTPDVVLPLEQSNGSGGVNLPVLLFSPTDQLTTTFTLPQNIEQAYLDVVAQSQSTDEQWFACFPNDLSNINELYGCGNTDFRETEVTIDGQLAGIAPVSPWVYTGFLPDQWRPIPAAQTLDFVPYRVNLTPFAGVLSNGQPHTVALSVFNDDFYFSTTASLLLYLDSGSAQVTGAVTKNTLTSPSPVVTEKLKGTSTVTGMIAVKSARNFAIAGYANTSHGQVSTSVSGQQDFASTQTIDFDTVTFSVLDQKTSVNTSLDTVTTATSNDGRTSTHETFSFPITVDLILPVNNSTFGFTVATAQNYRTSKLVLQNGQQTEYSWVNNSVAGSDVNPPSSSQQYKSFDMQGAAYNCQIASASNVLTSVSPGCDK
jgi:Peptide N-acetyl-beta-D-glucosaminyl asparaginase amidase A